MGPIRSPRTNKYLICVFDSRSKSWLLICITFCNICAVRLPAIQPQIAPTMNCPSTDRGSANIGQPRGFTLVELLVCISIVVVLAALAVSVAVGARTSAAKVVDMSRLRSLSLAAMTAGNDNAGRLPQIHSGAKAGSSNSAPYWLADNAYLESNGIYKEACYAPGKNIYGGAPKYDWWRLDQPKGTPVHYAYFANDGNLASDAWFLKGKVTPPDMSEYRGSIPYETIIKDASKAFVRCVGDDSWYTVLWAGLCRDYAGTPTVAAIMKDGKPLGVNIIHLDGHGEWVPKDKIKLRYTAGSIKISW